MQSVPFLAWDYEICYYKSNYLFKECPMRGFFRSENPLFQFINHVVESAWLNMLWFFCCLPIITIGPATTALHYCCQKIANDEDEHLTLDFFHSFKVNFKQGALIGIFTTLAGIALVLDFLGLYDRFFTSPLWACVGVLFTLAGIAYLMILLWIYPLLAHFSNSTVLMVRNSLFLGVKYLPLTVIMALVYAAMAFLALQVSSAFMFLGVGSCALLNTIFINRILIGLEENE